VIDEVVNLPHLSFPGMSQAVRAGNVIYLSGQVALADGHGIVGDGDPRAQAEQCFRNLDALLRAAGTDLGAIVKLTCYLTDIGSYPDYAAVKQALFASQPPASTAVLVAGLLDERFLLEVDAVAVVD
jgi:2-iminobutanoate/2-iminopropanoate deaminase